MSREKVGIISEIEKDDIQKLYERQQALNELMMCLETMELTKENRGKLYNRIVNDKAETVKRFTEWWNDKAHKYGWKRDNEGRWSVDFHTNEVYLSVR